MAVRYSRNTIIEFVVEAEKLSEITQGIVHWHVFRCCLDEVQPRDCLTHRPSFPDQLTPNYLSTYLTQDSSTHRAAFIASHIEKSLQTLFSPNKVQWLRAAKSVAPGSEQTMDSIPAPAGLEKARMVVGMMAVNRLI